MGIKSLFPVVLIVDDDLDFCTIISNKIRDICKIETVSSLTDAIDRLKK